MTDVVPLEIKPYVAVGPSSTLSITVHKDTFDKGFLIASLLLLLIIGFVVGLMLYFSITLSRLPPPPPPLNTRSSSSTTAQELTLATNYGAANSASYLVNKNLKVPIDGSELTTKEICEETENTQWNGSACICQHPFFGPSCSRERHDNSYFAVGIPNEETLRITVIDEIMTDNKSFNVNGSTNSCSDHCNTTPGCNGFIYHNPGSCTLLRNDVIIPEGETISYSHDIDSTLYMKDSQNLHFEGRIILGEMAVAVPPRYWLVKETKYYAQMFLNTITKIAFAPNFTLMHGSYTGIYCRFPFTMDQVSAILARGVNSECYIHQADVTINLPSDWKYKTPLYVVYIN